MILSVLCSWLSMSLLYFLHTPISSILFFTFKIYLFFPSSQKTKEMNTPKALGYTYNNPNWSLTILICIFLLCFVCYRYLCSSYLNPILLLPSWSLLSLSQYLPYYRIYIFSLIYLTSLVNFWHQHVTMVKNLPS